jgi:tRNA-dihydrouridine synthase 1
LKTHTAWSGVKGHLFKLMRPGLVEHHDLREQLGRMRKDDFDEAERICIEMKKRMDVRLLLVLCGKGRLTARQRDILAAADRAPEELVVYAPADPAAVDAMYASSRKTLPHWLAQPHWRANSSTKGGTIGAAKAKGAVQPEAVDKAVPAPSSVLPPAAPVAALVQDALVVARDAPTPEEQTTRFHEALATSEIAVDAGDITTGPWQSFIRRQLDAFHTNRAAQ